MSRARLALLRCIATVPASAAPAAAVHDRSNFSRMDLLYASPNPTNVVDSDLAWVAYRYEYGLAAARAAKHNVAQRAVQRASTTAGAGSAALRRLAP